MTSASVMVETFRNTLAFGNRVEEGAEALCESRMVLEVVDDRCAIECDQRAVGDVFQARGRRHAHSSRILLTQARTFLLHSFFPLPRRF